MTPTARKIADDLLALFTPIERMPLSQWSEKYIKLPEGSSARPGDLRNWPYMRAILDAIGDPRWERVTVMKSARLGYTKGLMFAMGATAAIDPTSIILLVPTDDDARRMAVEEVEPIFDASPELRGLIKKGRNDGRNTLVRKSLLGGGSLKILSARAPRKLRAHDAKVLLIDEADGMEITKEGDPISIAIGRTFAHSDRKIVIGSTPTEEGLSVVERQLAESNEHIFEVPCPECGAFNEIQWHQIEWEKDEDGHKPETARWRCPACQELIHERWKPQMIEQGTWRGLRPEITDHIGFRINALVSLLGNASWPKLAKEFLKAKRGGPAELQPFYNLVLGRPWRTTINKIDADILRERAEEGISTEAIPEEVLLITVGADVQDDRIEATILGWPLFGAPIVLGHRQFDGSTLEDDVWRDFDTFTKAKWRHPNGWRIGIDGVAVDSGGREGRTQKVYDWCYPRLHRRIYAIKGVAGPKKIWEPAKKVKNDMKLVNIAVDVVKTEVLEALSASPVDESGERNPNCLRTSASLDDNWYEQVTNEVRRVKYVNNRPQIVFEVKREGLRTEALDCTVYGFAVRRAPAVRSIDLKERAARRPEPETPPDPAADPPPKKPKDAGDWAALFNQQ